MDLQGFRGTGVAIITPFKSDKSVDYDALGRLIDFWIAGKVNYLVVLGTTGETATLEKEEKQAVEKFVIEKTAKRVPIVLGLGGNNTAELEKNISNRSFENIDAILSISPYYNKPNQKGLYEHYKVLAQVSPLPIILYNVPGRTGMNMTADTQLKLASDFKNIVATKEACGNIDQISALIQNKPENFLVISGDDALTLPLISLGADGIISVIANAYPAQFSEMVNLALAGNFAEARKIHYKLLASMHGIFTEGSPAGVKAVLHKIGLIENQVRLPLTAVSQDHYEKMASYYSAIK
jgi:4-hydroxy-tetrahydrodipicolinate synthase